MPCVVKPRKFAFSVEAPPRAACRYFVPRPIFFDPWNAYLEAKKIGTQTEVNCATTVNGHGNRKNPSGQKIESFIFCSAFLVPRNAKQRRGNCHNPIFTPEIFSGVDTQNEVVRTEQDRLDRGPPHQKNLKTGPRAHFSEAFDRTKNKIWLTNP